MKTSDAFPELTKKLFEYGVSVVTDIREEGKGAAIANTYFLQLDQQNYMIDPACGRGRMQQIKEQLPFADYKLLVTHSHLDHSANSGLAAKNASQIVFHPRVAGRINNLKRNYTEITAAMVSAFGIDGFFGRTGMFGPSMIKIMKTAQEYTPALFDFLLYEMSMVICRKTVGSIHVPKKNICFLNENERQELQFRNASFSGWQISERLFALDTPGHQDDHLAFYVPDRKVMFSGDLIGFLNPNDILDGSIIETHKGMLKMLELAKAGGIEVLALSHQLPLLGKDSIIAYLQSVIEKQAQTFNLINEVIASCENPSDFNEIIQKTYKHDSELMKKILKINYPRTVSFIDVYVYHFLKEQLFKADMDYTLLPTS